VRAKVFTKSAGIETNWQDIIIYFLYVLMMIFPDKPSSMGPKFWSTLVAAGFPKKTHEFLALISTFYLQKQFFETGSPGSCQGFGNKN